MVRRVVDREWLDRLLDRVAYDLKALTEYRAAGDLLENPTRLAAVKYHFITTIDGCARIAHHIIASEGWRIAESNADAVRALSAQHVVRAATAEGGRVPQRADLPVHRRRRRPSARQPGTLIRSRSVHIPGSCLVRRLSPSRSRYRLRQNAC
jgi:hypothetical protein